MNENLLEWIFDQRAKLLRASRKIIMAKAKVMHDEMYANDPSLRILRSCFERLA